MNGLAAGDQAHRRAKLNCCTANVRALLDNDRPSEAISLLEDGVERAAHDPVLELRLRHFLAAALFYAGEYTRAATLFDAVGRDYRKHLPPADPSSSTAPTTQATPTPRSASRTRPSRICGSTCRTPMPQRTRTRRARSSNPASSSRRCWPPPDIPDEALTELKAVRPLLADAFGADSTQVRNLNKQIDRLRSA